ncbi:diacylglycerol/lipid kinase family protein [Sphingomonas radiodurans]|uniref:diacylglycerol/lipid kinase family protein n=1 Tax=Sphingomonas radiodurans TaxID=2890321 RepID=UPI001E43244E|nr:acylglycerol kinase family protein [Sphingomonas radiodurans]WBH16205.1 acylglycerol kinase family protein [Sphingomonas radiodurans]
MRRLWIITNPASGSTSPARCAEVEALLRARGDEIVGRTDFPADPLPSVATIDAAGVDTVVLFAGDGTINAAVCALADWSGAILILPGGTMNLLARVLHGEHDITAIIATDEDRLTALPFVEAGPHRAFVALILGPAAHWARAREAARAGRLRRLIAAARNSWRNTFARGIRLAGATTLDGRYQAVMVQPADARLALAAIDARDWRSIATLGWEWLTGDWIAARAVSTQSVDRFAVAGRRPVLALFDGEPVLLDPGVPISSGRTAERFVSTISAER